jgi:hypothetical protein
MKYRIKIETRNNGEKIYIAQAKKNLFCRWENIVKESTSKKTRITFILEEHAKKSIQIFNAFAVGNVEYKKYEVEK